MPRGLESNPAWRAIRRPGRSARRPSDGRTAEPETFPRSGEDAQKVLLPSAGGSQEQSWIGACGQRVVPGRGLLPGSVSPLRGPARRSAPGVRAHARQCRASRARSPMADSPPQRIHALLAAIPRPGTPHRSVDDSTSFGQQSTCSRSTEPDAATSRVLAAGDRGQAKHGCFARKSGQDALTERRAIPGRQGAASFRQRK